MSDNPITHTVEAHYESALPIVVGVPVGDHPVNTDDENPKPCYKDRRNLIFGIIVIVAVVIAVIVTSQLLGNFANGDDVVDVLPSVAPSTFHSNIPTRANNLIPSYMPTNTPTLSPRRVLQSLFDSTNGPSWKVTWNFSSAQSYCEFQGITCDDSEQITEIDLVYNNLRGLLPIEIGMLSSLKYLDLLRNSIMGTIPSEIGMLSSLSALDLDRNLITGTIPSEIGMLSSLEHLDLDFNYITGTIPSEIGMLSSLFYLDLDNNLITGTIPMELCALTNTRIIYDGSEISCTCIGSIYIVGTPCN